MAGLVTLLLSQVAEGNDLMTVRHAHSFDQPQRHEEQTRNSPAVAFVRFRAATVFDKPALIRWTTSTKTMDLSSTENTQHITSDSKRLQHCQA